MSVLRRTTVALASVLVACLAASNAREPAATPSLDPGWVRRGPLGPTPARTTDALPLSDQANAAGWSKVESLSDEFSGDRPDTKKWCLTNESWPGRTPFAFAPANVSLRDGWLVLTATPRLTGEVAAALPAGFTHGAAFVGSNDQFRYCYAELRAVLADASITSAFFLMQTTAESSTEIDVFEIAAGDRYWGRRMGMNRHVLKLPGYVGTAQDHPQALQTWIAPFAFSDQPHVFGLEWDPADIAWYVDGVLVHRARNSHHHGPLRLMLDLEPQLAYAANPMENRLPARFRIDYVRVWARAMPPATTPQR